MRLTVLLKSVLQGEVEEDTVSFWRIFMPCNFNFFF